MTNQIDRFAGNGIVEFRQDRIPQTPVARSGPSATRAIVCRLFFLSRPSLLLVMDRFCLFGMMH